MIRPMPAVADGNGRRFAQIPSWIRSSVFTSPVGSGCSSTPLLAWPGVCRADPARTDTFQGGFPAVCCE
eukprot:g59743.t1